MSPEKTLVSLTFMDLSLTTLSTPSSLCISRSYWEKTVSERREEGREEEGEEQGGTIREKGGEEKEGEGHGGWGEISLTLVCSFRRALLTAASSPPLASLFSFSCLTLSDVSSIQRWMATGRCEYAALICTTHDAMNCATQGQSVVTSDLFIKLLATLLGADLPGERLRGNTGVQLVDDLIVNGSHLLQSLLSGGRQEERW